MTLLKRDLQYAWLAALVLFVVVYYGVGKWDVLKAAFAALLLEGLLFIVIGERVLIYVMQRICEHHEVHVLRGISGYQVAPATGRHAP